MIARVQRADERGGGQVTDWLHTRHTFSFGSWFHPDFVQWGALRVLNDDVVGPRQGFGFHFHRDMEIVTYVLGGAIHHRDSHGNAGAIRPGEAQRMSAGSGVRHSEWNEGDEPCHMLQVWIFPRKEALGGPFSYEQARIPDGAREAGWHAVADGRRADATGLREGAPAGADGRKGQGTVSLQQDAAILATILAPGGQRPYRLAAGRKGLLFVAGGKVHAAGEGLDTGDSLWMEGPEELHVRAEHPSHLLLFDVPG